jgi:hypothetical protein
MIRTLRTSIAALALVTASAALADIPPPVGGQPNQGTSPGTGQTSPGKIPNPIGNPSNVIHPDPNVGNLPPLPWFQNSFYPELIALHDAAFDLAQWGGAYNPNIAYFSNWLGRVTNDILSYTYFNGNAPLFYPTWGYYVLRGDLQYWNYWYVRPLYFQILREGAVFAHTGPVSFPGPAQYFDKIGRLADAYHHFIRCLHGKNGTDPDAADDTDTGSYEADAGLGL